jgi:predicted Zn-ribbon and HTH transcriptional regulator
LTREVVLALKHHELNYHKVTDIMLEEERKPVESKHSKEERLDMIVMKCEACGYSTQGYKKGQVEETTRNPFIQMYSCHT